MTGMKATARMKVRPGNLSLISTAKKRLYTRISGTCTSSPREVTKAGRKSASLKKRFSKFSQPTSVAVKPVGLACRDWNA